MRKIFVTAVGGDIGSSVLKCLTLAFPDDILIGCDINKYNPGIEYLNKFFLSPPYTDKKSYLQFIENVCLNEHITHFMPVSETELLIADGHRKFFKDNDIKLVLNNSKILEVALDKHKTAVYLNQNDIDAPIVWLPEELKEPSSYPIVIKGRQGCGSKNLCIAQNADSYRKAVIEIENPVVQQYIGTADDEYTIAVFSNGHNTNTIAFKRQLGFGGMSVRVESVDDPEITEIGNKLSKLFDLVGSINVQMRKENGKYYIFEINPRISSTIGFRAKLGFNDVKWWFESLDKPDKTIMYIPEKRQVIGIRVLDEKIFYVE